MFAAISHQLTVALPITQHVIGYKAAGLALLLRRAKAGVSLLMFVLQSPKIPRAFAGWEGIVVCANSSSST
jgi:hypothetical protein